MELFPSGTPGMSNPSEVPNTFPLDTEYGRVAIHFPSGTRRIVAGAFALNGQMYDGWVEFTVADGFYDPLDGIRFHLCTHDPAMALIAEQNVNDLRSDSVPVTIVHGVMRALVRRAHDAVDNEANSRLRQEGDSLDRELRRLGNETSKIVALIEGNNSAIRALRGVL